MQKCYEWQCLAPYKSYTLNTFTTKVFIKMKTITLYQIFHLILMITFFDEISIMFYPLNFVI